MWARRSALLAAVVAAGTIAAQAAAQTAPDPPANIAPSSSDAVQALDAARAQMGLGPYVLPGDFLSLPADEQIFILANLDRVAYGLRPMAGLDRALESAAQPSTANDTDPSPPSGYPVQSWASNWAAGFSSPLFAYYFWMYDDGYPGGNVDCTAPTAAGCWAHRHNFLAFPSVTVALGVATGTDSSGRASVTTLAVVPAGTPTYYYTWANATADGAGGVPAAPSDVSATAGDGEATISFTAPTGEVTSYTVTASPGGRTATGTASPIAVSGLADGTAYTFTVTATNGAGTGPPSSPSNAVTTRDTQPPTAPARLAGHFTHGALVLSWSAATDNVGVDHYVLDIGAAAVMTIPGTTTTASVRTFEPHVRSVFTLRAVDAAGNVSSPSTGLAVRPLSPPGNLPKPIPRWAWQMLRWQQSGGRRARPSAPKTLPSWYWAWKRWRLEPFALVG